MRRRVSLLISLLLAVGSVLVLPKAPAFAVTPAAPVSSVAVPFVGQPVTLSGNIGTPAIRTVVLQKYSSSWGTYASGQTQADGSYAFTASSSAASTQFRVYAPVSGALPAVTSAVLNLKTQKDVVTLKLTRYGNYLWAAGVASPVITGRLFALQYKTSTGWAQVGSKAAESSAGKILIKVAVNGSKTYRLVGAAVTGSSGAISPSVSFSPSPSKLGQNVIYVKTDSGATPTTKGVDYTGSAILVSGATVSPSYRLETIAVRGNTTATKPKKPYKIKFEEKQEPFGMPKDKTWILLANYIDWTLIRSRIAFELGRLQDGLQWIPTETYTELYLNGKYLGSYQMIQSIKIDKKRVPIDKETGQVMEHDPHWVTDENEGFIGKSGMNYSFKDPDTLVKTGGTTEDLTPARIKAMKNKILQFEKILYSKDWSKITGSGATLKYNGTPLAAKDDWQTYLDLNSAVDYILTREFTKDNDADFYRSNFFYTNNYLPFFTGTNATYGYSWTGATSADKFFMGPIWDFDRSAGAHPNAGTGIEKPTGWWTNGSGSPNHDTNKIHWFTRIWKDPRFVKAVKDRWALKRVDYRAVATSRVDAAVSSLSLTAAVNDRVRWDGSGSRYAAKASSSASQSGFLKEIAWVKKWYKDRYNWMDSKLSPSGQTNPIP